VSIIGLGDALTVVTGFTLAAGCGAAFVRGLATVIAWATNLTRIAALFDAEPRIAADSTHRATRTIGEALLGGAAALRLVSGSTDVGEGTAGAANATLGLLVTAVMAAALVVRTAGVR
jgi:hypothetical protein